MGDSLGTTIRVIKGVLRVQTGSYKITRVLLMRSTPPIVCRGGSETCNGFSKRMESLIQTFRIRNPHVYTYILI